MVWNVAGLLHSPKNITSGSKSPRFVRNAAFHSSPSFIWTLLNPIGHPVWWSTWLLWVYWWVRRWEGVCICSWLSLHLGPDSPEQAVVTTLFSLSLLLWTFELYLILSYRYEDILISWSYLLILSRRSYLGDLISWSLDHISWSTILSWSLDHIIWWWSKIRFFIWTLHYYLHAFDMPLTYVFHWRSTYILHMLLRNTLLPYTWHALNTHFTCVYLGQHIDISV